MEVTDHQRKYVRDLLIKGSKIEAIKYLKDSFGLSLKDAKLLAEKIDESIQEHEYQYDRSKKAIGCRPGGCKGGCIGYIFTGIGVLLLGVAAIGFYLEQRIVNYDLRVTGVVVENPSQPVIEYTFDTETFRIQASVSSSPPSYEIGEEVELFLNPDDPNEVVINTFSERWLGVVIMGFIGIVFVGIGVLVLKLFK